MSGFTKRNQNHGEKKKQVHLCHAFPPSHVWMVILTTWFPQTSAGSSSSAQPWRNKVREIRKLSVLFLHPLADYYCSSLFLHCGLYSLLVPYLTLLFCFVFMVFFRQKESGGGCDTIPPEGIYQSRGHVETVRCGHSISRSSWIHILHCPSGWDFFGLWSNKAWPSFMIAFTLHGGKRK